MQMNWRTKKFESGKHMRGKIALEEYFAQNNFWLTTSDNFRTQTLIDAMLEIGADRILFSTDWPFGRTDVARLFKFAL
jgi:gamma-resorcylate decarboxylase